MVESVAGWPEGVGALNLGAHLVSRGFTAKCAECDETAGHFFRGATFGSDWFLCDLHCALYFLDEALSYAPDEIASAVASLATHPAFAGVVPPA